MQVGLNQPGWRPWTRSGRSSRMTIRTHIGVRLTVVRLSGVVETISRSPPCTIYAASSKSVHPESRFSSDGLSTSQPRVRNGAVNCGVRSLFMPDPGLDTRQHERPVNKRAQRVRKRNAGSQAEPEALRAHIQQDSIEPENGTEVAEVKECEGYARPRTQRCRQLNRGWNLGRENVGSNRP